MVDEVIDAARIIREDRYAGPTAVFAAGSIVRGEGTPYSDLDLVVVYPDVACAYRESFRVRNLPVEAFVHDPETLKLFLRPRRRAPRARGGTAVRRVPAGRTGGTEKIDRVKAVRRARP